MKKIEEGTSKRLQQAKRDLKMALKESEKLEDRLIGLIPVLQLNGLLKNFEIAPVSLPYEE